LAVIITVGLLSSGALAAASLGLRNPAAAPLPQQSPVAAHAALVELFDEFREARRVPTVEGVPDYTPAAIEARRDALAEIRGRFDRIDAEDWEVAQKADYLLVRSQLDAEEFLHRVTRPWARDPGLVVDQVRRTAYAEVPAGQAEQARLRSRLQAVVRGLDRARETLAEPSGELARMAIRQLERSDGVNQGEPRRDPPPEGVIGWYRDLLGRVESQAPDLAGDAGAALGAVEGFRDWLAANEPRMTEPAYVGLDEYDWYLEHVLLMPYTSADLRVLAERERARARTFLKIEEHSNRGLPPIELVTSAEEHEARVRDAEELIRDFIAAHELLSIPETIPPTFETDAFWIVREGGKRHFWEEITYRDPLNNHIHASIPGHRFDGILQRAESRPIRRGYRNGVRSEGWAFYIEEMFLQAGLLDDRPRAKELFYIAQLKRAARVPAELAMQTGEFTLQDAIRYLVDEVPLMEDDLARYDLSIYLRRPTYGMNYVMGKVQMEKLLSDRALQLGDAFDLGRFHDEFLAAGSIPISLIRWEMTGNDDEIRQLW
jgi:hypothetical protein